MAQDRVEGKGGEAASMHPAALDHDHSKSHGIGKAFAGAHGHQHHGMVVSPSAGPSAGPTNNDSAPEFAGE